MAQSASILRPPEDQSTLISRPSPVGGSGTDPAAEVYLFADRSSVGDPSTILASAASAGSNLGEISFPIAAGGAATLPNATNIGGAYVEWAIVDVNGNPASIASTDVRQFWAWLGEAISLLATDTYVGVALTAGGVAGIGNSGLFAGIRQSASGNVAFLQPNAGAGSGWTAETLAAAADLLTRGIRPEMMCGSTLPAALRQAVPIDAAGERVSTTSTTVTVPAQANIMFDGPFTHVALVVGRSGAAGGTTTITAGLRSFATAINQLDDWENLLAPTAPAAVNPPKKFLIIGESNTVSPDPTPNPTWSGQPMQTGWTERFNGVNTTTYSATNSPGVGAVPYLINHAISRGASSGTRWVVRRGTVGVDTSWPGTMVGQFSGAIADVTALGGGDPDLIIFCYGANDAQTALEAAAFILNARRALRILRREYPQTPIALWKERTTDPGTYPNLPDIYVHLATLATEFQQMFVIDSTTAPAAGMADGIHFSAVDGGGQEIMANRTITAVYG